MRSATPSLRFSGKEFSVVLLATLPCLSGAGESLIFFQNPACSCRWGPCPPPSPRSFAFVLRFFLSLTGAHCGTNTGTNKGVPFSRTMRNRPYPVLKSSSAQGTKNFTIELPRTTPGTGLGALGVQSLTAHPRARELRSAPSGPDDWHRVGAALTQEKEFRGEFSRQNSNGSLSFVRERERERERERGG